MEIIKYTVMIPSTVLRHVSVQVRQLNLAIEPSPAECRSRSSATMHSISPSNSDDNIMINFEVKK
jgi:hypothetical protein